MHRWAPLIVPLGLAAALLAPLAVPAPALAHAELVAADPEPNASLVDPPTQLRISFSEPIDATTVVIDVLDTQLQRVERDVIEIADDGRVASRRLPTLEPGVYTVSYQVISIVDGHATAGRFAFAIDPSGSDAPPTAAPSSTSPSVDPLAIGVRWVALAAALVAFGAIALWWHAGRHVLRDAAPRTDRRPPWRLIGAAAAATFVGLATYLALAARPIGEVTIGQRPGFPLDFAAPFGWTPFAIAMRVALIGSLAAAILVLGVLLTRRRRSAGGDEAALAVAVAALMAIALAGMSAAGHAASLGGPVAAALDWAHLLAAAIWLGGLPAVAPLARRGAGSISQPSAVSLAGSMLRRHGGVALVAGPLVVVTGLANSPVVLGASRELVASGYGNLLIAKAGLASLALGIGAVNHLALRRPRSLGGVQLLVGAEVLIAAFAVMAAATMVTVQPGAARQPILAGASVNPAHLYGDAGPSRIHASVSLPAPGEQSYQVTVADALRGGPRSDVQKVFVTLRPPPGSGLPTERIELKPREPDGLYGIRGAHTPVVGNWGLDVTVRRVGALDESAGFEISVAEPSAPRIGPPPDTGVGIPAPIGALWSVLPRGPLAWLPAVLALLAVAALAVAGRGVPSRWLPPLRVALVVVAALAVLGAGSRSVVEAANEPSTADLASHVPADQVGDPRKGERIYRANCASCHGADGSGNGPVAVIPAPTDLRIALATLSDDELSYRIVNGLAGTPMPPFATILTEEERWDLVSYLREQWDDR